MSRSLALILAITLGLPVLSIVVLAEVAGVHTDLLRAFLSGGVVFAFVTAAIFEVRRLAGLDAPLAAEHAPAPVGTAQEPIIVAPPAADTAMPIVVDTPVQGPAVETPPVPAAAPAEPIVVAATSVAAETPAKRTRRKAAGPTLSAVASLEEGTKPAGRARKSAPKAS
ncbi:MAG TPA: hypothetical protein VIL09_17690 [Microvirga sp.]|jgi:hypothetical protein